MYEVVRLSRSSWGPTTGAPEILGSGGQHSDLHAAVVESAARNVSSVPEGSAPEWHVIQSDDPTRTPVDGETCEPDEVYDYLVDVLGLPADQAERMVG